MDILEKLRAVGINATRNQDTGSLILPELSDEQQTLLSGVLLDLSGTIEDANEVIESSWIIKKEYQNFTTSLESQIKETSWTSTKMSLALMKQARILLFLVRLTKRVIK